MQESKQQHTECQACGKPVLFHICTIEQRKIIKEQHLCEVHGDQLIQDFNSSKVSFEESDDSSDLNGSISFEPEMLFFREQAWETSYSLLENTGDRRFIFKMGYSEAGALYWNLQDPNKRAPTIYDGFATTIFALGASLQDVTIDGSSNDLKVLSASLRFLHDGESLNVKVRPSDALNFAVLFDAPIFISQNVLSRVKNHGKPPDTPCLVVIK